MSEQLKVGVCGAGAMGSGIAQVAAQAGCTVVVYDTFAPSREKSESAITKDLAKSVERGRLSEDAAAVGAAVDDGALHEAASAGAASAAGALGLARNLPLTAPEVRFENVSFAYNSSEPPVLHGVTFTAPAGGMTCLVGGSGSGKSTCLRLLARLREPTEGSRILLWGSLDLQTLPICAVRDRISYISQDPELFDDTLEWNLRYGNLAAPPAAVEAAAAAAELSSRVPGLGGYLMRVG